MGDSTAERKMRRRVGLAAARAVMAAADDEYAQGQAAVTVTFTEPPSPTD
jgi:hypothetical protein